MLPVRVVCNNIRFIIIVYIFFEKPDSVWKKNYFEVRPAGDRFIFGKSLMVKTHFSCALMRFFRTFLHLIIMYLLFTEKSGGHGMVLRLTITTSA